jgi:membrane protein implicated in regulation of membrane protease activity
MFNDIRFIAAMRTLAIVVAVVAGAVIFNVALIYGGYQFIMFAVVVGVLYLTISGVYSLMLYEVKQEQESKKLTDSIANITNK